MAVVTPVDGSAALAARRPRRMPVTLRLATSVLVCGAILATAVLGAFLYMSARDQSAAMRDVEHERLQIVLYEDLRVVVMRQSADLAAYYAVRTPAYALGFRDARAQADALIAQLREGTTPGEWSERGGLDDLGVDHAALSAEQERVLQAMESGDISYAFAIAGNTGLEVKSLRFDESVTQGVAAAREELTTTLARDQATQGRMFTWALGIVSVWGALVIALALASFLAVIHPLERIRKTTQAIARGDFSARVRPSGPREFVDVAMDVNAMAESLIRRADELNAYLSRNLEARTLELEGVNSALAEAERRFRSLVQNASDVICVIEADTVIRYVSPAVEQVLGQDPGELLGTPLSDAVHPADAHQLVSFMRDAARAPAQVAAASFRLRHSDSSWRHIDVVGKDGRDDPAIRGFVLNMRDASERERSAAALRESEERFRAVVQNSSDMIMILDATGTPTYASPSVERITGYSLDDFQRVGVLSMIHPDDLQRGAESLAAVLLESGAHPPTVLRFRQTDGSWREIEMVANNMLDEPAVAGVVYNARDVTQQRVAERAMKQSEERFRSLVQNASDLITVIDPATNVLYQSPSSAQVLGYEPGEMYGSQLVRFIHRDDRAVLLNFVREVMTKAVGPPSTELRLLHNDGSWRAVEIMGTDQRANASIGGIVLNIRDIGERKILEEQLRRQAFSDVLTGLANRVRFIDHLEHGLLRAARERTVVGVVFLDLDDFKSVNDSLGHATGDALLVAVAARLREVVRPGDTFARFGGDEFAVLLEDASGTDEAVRVAKRIIEALRPPFEVDGHQWFVRASLGVSLSTSGQIGADDLMRNADVAMYVAKGRGKGRFELYEESMHDALLERVALLSDLQEAIAGVSEFVVHYQPVLRLETGEIVGVEALVRWQHPQRGLVLPDQFISLAEESGAILPLGRWVLGQACRQVRTWQVEYSWMSRLTVAVNVSVRQLQHPAFLQEVREALEGSGLDPADLVLEITESIMMQDVETTVARLSELKSLGIRLAIDDFGTGYSSLSYLQQFPLDILKIDQSFVSTVMRGADGADLPRAIVQIAKTLGLETVAEGIEQLEQLSVLRSLGCDLGQGYYFARPLSSEQMDAYLATATRERHAA